MEINKTTKKTEIYNASKNAVIIDLAPNSEYKIDKVEDSRYRLNKMEQTLKNASGFKLASRYGTNLDIPLRRFSGRRWHKDTGMIDEVGKWDNLPGGEIFTTPNEQRVSGVLVSPVLESTIINERGVDEFVHINIKNGVISSIRGGGSAEKLRKQLTRDVKG